MPHGPHGPYLISSVFVHARKECSALKDLKFQAKFSRDRIVCPILAFSLSISKAERFPDSLVDSLLVNFGGVVLALLVIVVVVVQR